MKFLRNSFTLAALVFPLLANAGVFSFSFNGAVTNLNPISDTVYAAGTPVTGVFHIDDGVPVQTPDDDYRGHIGAFSGTVYVGENRIDFTDSYAYIFSSPTLTYLTMLGGDRWNTGGTISETNPPDATGINGFQIMFIYPGFVSANTPITEFLNSIPASHAFWHMDYGVGASSGDFADITALQESAPVPEPSGIFLICLGLGALAGVRIWRKTSAA